MSLPNEFLLNDLKSSAAGAATYVSRVTPESGTSFVGGNILEFHIAAGRPNEWLRPSETSFTFTVTNDGGDDAANNAEFSGGAWSVINKISIFQGATLIEEIQDYATLHQLLYNQTASAEYASGISAQIHGTNQLTTAMTSAELLKGATVEADGGQYHAAVQLVSCIVGTLSEKAIPIGYMSDAIRVQIELNTTAQAFVSTGAPVIKLTNCELQCQIVKLDPAVDAELMQANDGVLSWHTSTFRHYANSIQNGEKFAVISLPMRFSSLRYAMHLLRPAGNFNVLTKRTIDAREKARLKQFVMRRGHEMIPQRPVEVSSENTSQVILELLRTAGKLETYGADHGLMFTNKAIFTADDVSANGAQGQFAFAIDMNAFSSSLDDLQNSGANLLSTPLSVELSFEDAGTPHACRLTSYASFDCLIILDLSTGLLSTRF